MRRRSSTIQASSLEEYYDISISQGLEMQSSSSFDFPESSYCYPLPEYTAAKNKVASFNKAKAILQTKGSLELLEMEECSDDDEDFDGETPSTECGSPMAKSLDTLRRFSGFSTAEKSIVVPNEVQIIKSMVIGVHGTGKYSLIDNMFDEVKEETEKAKNGFDLIIKNKEEIGLTKTFKFWIQDPSYQHIDSLLQVYYRSIARYVFTYKVEDRESFEILDRVIGQVKAKVGDKFRAILIGSVTEGEEARKVDSEEGENLRRKYNLESFSEGNGASEELKARFFSFLI